MNIKVTDKILSIPPYISTSWSNISALHMKGSLLVITLFDGDTLHIPDLKSDTIHLIFENHTNYLEKELSFEENDMEISNLSGIIQKSEPSIRLAFGGSIENLGGMMQHNPDQADAPNLPPEILQKIGAIAKIISPSEEMLLPRPEQGCNCFFCQIATALNPEPVDHLSISEPVVTDEDLHFQQWDIHKTDDKLYSVVNRLDDHEKYNVYLGQPVGCTCGKEGCEHILAVLKS